MKVYDYQSPTPKRADWPRPRVEHPLAGAVHCRLRGSPQGLAESTRSPLLTRVRDCIKHRRTRIPADADGRTCNRTCLGPRLRHASRDLFQAANGGLSNSEESAYLCGSELLVDLGYSLH
jgi:hypothetical protein